MQEHLIRAVLHASHRELSDGAVGALIVVGIVVFGATAISMLIWISIRTHKAVARTNAANSLDGLRHPVRFVLGSPVYAEEWRDWCRCHWSGARLHLRFFVCICSRDECHSERNIL